MQLSDRIGRRMKLQHIHILMTVAQAGSMKKAAALLNTSQPAISRSIAELEHTIGVRLLDRNTQGIEPTEYGRAMLKHGGAAFDELKQGVKNIELLADPGAGEVRIGSSPYVAELFVSAIIKRLSGRYPRIVFHLVTAEETSTLHRELSERKIDLLIARRVGLFTNEKFGFEFLYDSSFVVVAGARNPWVRRRRIALAELVNEPWVLPSPEDVLGPAYLEPFRASGLDYPRTTVFAAPPGVRLNLLASGAFLRSCRSQY
jgi:DNA-binding transcriptional LysR family regulator